MLGILNAQNIHQLTVIEMRPMFDLMGFHEARKDKMQRQGKKKKLKNILCYQIINYKSSQLYAYELSVDYEPSLNTTIRQNTKML